MDQKTKTEIYGDFYQRQNNLQDWMMHSGEDVYGCISTVASIHDVDLKPLHTLFYSFLLLADFVLARLQQHDQTNIE